MPAALPLGSGRTRHGSARALILSLRFHANMYCSPACPEMQGEKTKIDEKTYRLKQPLTISSSVSTSSSRVAQLVAKRTTERVSS